MLDRNEPNAGRGIGLMIRWRSRLLVFLILSAIYLYAFPSATIFYGAGVLLHAGSGIALAILVIPILRWAFHEGALAVRFGWLFLAAGTILGLVLLKIGTPHRLRAWLYLHIALSSVGV